MKTKEQIKEEMRARLQANKPPNPQIEAIPDSASTGTLDADAITNIDKGLLVTYTVKVFGNGMVSYSSEYSHKTWEENRAAGSESIESVNDFAENLIANFGAKSSEPPQVMDEEDAY